MQSLSAVQTAVPVKKLIDKVNPRIIYSPYTDALLPITSCKQIITCHDLTPLYYPNSRRAYLRSKYWLPLHLNKADRLIAISHAVANQLIDHGIESQNIDVVPNGIEQSVHQISQPLSRDILVIARHARNKNVELALVGYAKLLQLYRSWEGYLVVVGQHDRCSPRLKYLERELGLCGRIKWIKSVSDSELEECYARAFCLISPSLMEGFDYPLLEAQARGLPTLASNISVHREFHETASLFFDIYDSGKSLGSQLYRLVHDINLWHELSHKGIANSKKYSIEKQLKLVLSLLSDS